MNKWFRGHALVSASACVVLLFAFSEGRAQWTEDTTVNTPLTAITTEISSNLHSVSDGLGGTITSMNVAPFFVAEYDVVVQRLDSNGVPVWGPNGVTLFENSDRYENQLISDGAGGAFVVWVSRDITNTFQVWAQHVGAGGALLWGAGGVDVCTVASDQTDVQLISDGAGGLIVAWADQYDAFYGVFAQRISSAGNLLWSPAGQQASIENLVPTQLRMASGSIPGTSVLVWVVPNGSDKEVRGQILNASGIPLFDEASMEIFSNTTDYITNTRITSDGNGGFYAVWAQAYGAEMRVVAHHILATGDPGFNGGSIGGWYSSQDKPELVTDGVGGAFVLAEDLDSATGQKRVFLQHLVSQGGVWGIGGITLADLNSSVPGRHFLASDGAGGMYAGWADGTFNGNQIQHILANGAMQWPNDRPSFTTRPVYEFSGLIPDGNGNIAVVFGGLVNPVIAYGFAQRLEQNGYPLDTAFAALSAVDRPNDQGGEVVLTWEKSPLDSVLQQTVVNYSYWVRPVAKAGTAAENHGGPTVLPDAQVATDLNMELPQVMELRDSGWTYGGMVPAVFSDDYSVFCPTYGDSTDVDISYSEFKVLAHHSQPEVFWEADNVLSGYSVDNLSPGAPLNLAGLNNAGAVDLSWNASGVNDEDLREYRIYRGDASGFPLDEDHLLATTADLELQDLTASGNVWYRATAVDAHGNEGSASNEIAVSLGVSAVGAVPVAFRHNGNYPNPFNPATHIAFDLPSEAPVVLTIFSVDGRQIATLVNRTMSAGSHRVLWNGQDSNGRAVASGVYYSRLQTDRDTAVGKMTLVR